MRRFEVEWVTVFFWTGVAVWALFAVSALLGLCYLVWRFFQSSD